MAGPTFARTCVSGRRSSATCAGTSTSRRFQGGRCFCRCIRSFHRHRSYPGGMAAPVAKDQELELDVDSLAYGGNGVARLDGFVVFVRRGLPGDRVRARVTKVKRRHAEALATEVLRPGPERVDAPCAHFPACGGCRLPDLAFEGQLEQKHPQGRDAPQRPPGNPRPPPPPALPPAPPNFPYPNKT